VAGYIEIHGSVNLEANSLCGTHTTHAMSAAKMTVAVTAAMHPRILQNINSTKHHALSQIIFTGTTPRNCTYVFLTYNLLQKLFMILPKI